MAKVRHFLWKHDDRVVADQWHFYCPGCRIIHAIGYTQHKFNGNVENPTFEPSVLVIGGGEHGKVYCHSYVRDGRIQFLGDCRHELVNQTVDLPEFIPELHGPHYTYID